MINNFSLVAPLFYFNGANNMFFHVQIVVRQKDHPNERMKESCLQSFFVKSREQLEKAMPKIISLCEIHGARAYINVSGKDLDKLQSLLMVKLSSDIHINVVRDPHRTLNSAAGSLVSRNPRWVVDIDDVSMKEDIREFLFELYAKAWEMKGSPISVEALKEVSEDYILAEIPTKNGVHFITRPFNTKEFGDKFPDVAIHKNSMGTVLYIPSSIDKPKYCCSVCGSTNIQVQAWVDANTNMYCSDITDNGECWCEDCGAHTLIKEVKNEKTDTDS